MIEVDQIVELSNNLRDEGMAVSIRTTQTAMDTCDLLDTNNKELLKQALRSVYVKNKYDIPKFNKQFDEVFKEKKSLKSVEQESTKMPRNYRSGSNKMRVVKNKKAPKAHVNSKFKNKLEMAEYLGTPPLHESDDDLERDSELLNKDLTKINQFEPRMLELCQELGRRIANKRSRRENQAKTNKIDIRRTIRTNLKYGGTTIDLVKAKPRPHKNQHLFLDDISGSCECISSWFFMLMYSCQTAFKDSRTFEFDNKTVETTEALKSNYLFDAFVKVKDIRIKNAMVHGTSDMYRAFNSFIKQADISNKTYIVILSDCRDWAGPKVNGVQASTDLVRQMVKLSKKVIILNPEDRNKWDIADSCVSLYEDAGAKVYEVNTLNQLADFVMDMH